MQKYIWQTTVLAMIGAFSCAVFILTILHLNMKNAILTATLGGALLGYLIGRRNYRKFVTPLIETKRKLTISEQHYRSLFQENPHAVFSLDLHGSFTSVNSVGEKILGVTKDNLVKAPFHPFVAKKYLDVVVKRFEESLSGKAKTYEIEVISLDEESVPIRLTTIPIIVDEEIVGVYGVAEEIRERLQSEAKIRRLAYYDTVTLLPNRTQFCDELGKLTEPNSSPPSLLGVIFLDLDRFKLVNDSLGHASGDLLLQTISSRLQSCVGLQGMVARFGGDEFALLLYSEMTVDKIRHISRGILNVIEQPVLINGLELRVTGSLGIALYPSDSTTPETLMKYADSAMYAAKKSGKNTYHFYSKSLEKRISKSFILENDLYKSIERNELDVHYQPQIDMVSGQVVGAEALLRWKHPEDGWIPPSEFVPLAEETGFIHNIGEWILCKACAQNKRWQDSGYPHIKISVNISVSQIQKPGFVDIVLKVLNHTGLDPKWLTFEITESVAMNSDTDMKTTLNKISHLGIGISIDDFGTGYSSLGSLHTFQFNTLKIDRTFLNGLFQNRGSESIILAIIAIGKNLGLEIVAEGVETQEQLQFLRMHSCVVSQGYLFSHPIPPHEFETSVFDKCLEQQNPNSERIETW